MALKNYNTFLRDANFIYALFGVELTTSPIPLGVPFSPFGFFGYEG